MVGLLVETEDFAYAAWAMSSGAGDPLTQALFRLQATLDGCAGMAGPDPAGRSWAAGYDPLVADALTGLRSLVNGCYRLSAMFAQTCRNYAAAESASTTDRWARASVEADVAQLPGECSVSWSVAVPGAGGPSAGGPPGWSVVAGLVGRVWLGGHQDRLHEAAAAWRSAAEAVEAAGARVRQVPGRFAANRLPEADDMAAGRAEMAGERALAAEGSRALQFGTVDLRAEEAAGGHTIANHVGANQVGPRGPQHA